MPLKISEDVRVIVEHTATDGTIFRDAIYLKPEQRAVLTEADLVVMGNARVTAWGAAVQAAKAAPAPVKTERILAEEIAVLEASKAQLEEQLSRAKGELTVMTEKVDAPIGVKR